MQSLIQQQVALLQRNNLISMMQLFAERRIDSDGRQDSRQIVEHLDAMRRSMEVGFAHLNPTVAANTPRSRFIPGALSAITSASNNEPVHTGWVERGREHISGRDQFDASSLKYKLGTARGLLNTTNLVTRGSGSLFDSMLAKRERKAQWLQDEQTLNADANLPRSIGKTFEKLEASKARLQKSTRILEGLRSRGIPEETISSSVGGKKLLADIEKEATFIGERDYRYKGLRAAAPAPTPTPAPDTTPAPAPSRSERLVNGLLPRTTPTFRERMNQTGGATRSSNLRERVRNNAGQGGTVSIEDRTELNRLNARQVALLERIEENTRPVEAEEDAVNENSSGGILGGIFELFKTQLAKLIKSMAGMLTPLAGAALKIGKGALTGAGNAIMGAVRSPLGQKVLGGAKKVLGPAAVVAGGIYEGYQDWNAAEEKVKSGEFTAREGTVAKGGAVGKGGGVIADGLAGGELGAMIGTAILPGVGTAVGGIIGAVVGGLAGGKFGEELGTIVTDGALQIGEAVTSYIIDPITKFFGDLKDSFFKMLADFSIPKISFVIPIINKEVSIGPFYPFKPDQPDQPERPVQSDQPERPVQSDQPIQHVQPENQEKPVQPLSTTMDANPIIAGKPVTPGKPLSYDQMEEIDEKIKDYNEFGKDLGEADPTPTGEVLKSYNLNMAGRKPLEDRVGWGEMPPPTQLKAPEAVPTHIADSVYKTSKENADSKAVTKQAPSTTSVVNAPTVNNSTTHNSIIRLPVRNNDPTVFNYLKSRY